MAITSLPPQRSELMRAGVDLKPDACGKEERPPRCDQVRTFYICGSYPVTFYRSDVKHGAILLRGVFSRQWMDVVKKGNLWKKSVNI